MSVVENGKRGWKVKRKGGGSRDWSRGDKSYRGKKGAQGSHSLKEGEKRREKGWQPIITRH